MVLNLKKDEVEQLQWLLRWYREKIFWAKDFNRFPKTPLGRIATKVGAGRRRKSDS